MAVSVGDRPTVSTTGVLIPYQARATAVRPYSKFGRITVFESGADSSYHGGFVQFSKRYAKNFQLQTSYTYSKVISISIMNITDASVYPNPATNEINI